MKKIIIYCSMALLLHCCLAAPVEAARQRPARGSSQTSRQPTVRQISGSTRGIKAVIKFRADRRALLVSFSNFNSSITSVSYLLTYDSAQGAQGGGGAVTAESAGSTRELLFGTSSAGVATYHTGLRNARLVIDTKLKSGPTIRKPYRIKV